MLHLGTDGILHFSENQTLMSLCLLRYCLWYFTFRDGTGWIRIGYRVSKSLNNTVSEEDLAGGGAEAKSIDVRSAERLNMPLV